MRVQALIQVVCMSDKLSGNDQVTGLQTSPPATGLPASDVQPPAAQRDHRCPWQHGGEARASRCDFIGPGSWMLYLFRNCPADADGQSRMKNIAPDSRSPDESVHCDLI